MDPITGEYNRPLLPPGVTLIPGYGRLQGIVTRPGDARLTPETTPEAFVETALADPSILMVNRNQGSGTRILIDRLLGSQRPPGHAYAPKSHNAVAAAVAQGRADWGVAIATVAADYALDFLPLQPEHYDFAIPTPRLTRPSIKTFITLLDAPTTREALTRKGFQCS